MELPTPESGAERLLVEMLRQVVMLRAPDSGLTPFGVSSKAHANTSAIGNPNKDTSIKMRNAHGGASNAGNPIDAACTVSHATTK